MCKKHQFIRQIFSRTRLQGERNVTLALKRLCDIGQNMTKTQHFLPKFSLVNQKSAVFLVFYLRKISLFFTKYVDFPVPKLKNSCKFVCHISHILNNYALPAMSVKRGGSVIVENMEKGRFYGEYLLQIAL